VVEKGRVILVRDVTGMNETQTYIVNEDQWSRDDNDAYGELCKSDALDKAMESHNTELDFHGRHYELRWR